MKTVTLIFVLLISSSAYSIDEKEGTATKLMRLKDRTLIIELPLNSKEYIEELKNRNKYQEIELYEKRCQYIRESLKTTFTKFWKFNNEIVFVSSDSIQTYMNGSTKLFAIMRYGNKTKLIYGEKFKNNYIMAYDRPRIFSLFLAEEEKEVLFSITPLKAALGEFIISIQSFNLSIAVYLSHPSITQSNVNSYTISKEDKPRFEAKSLIVLIKKEDIIKILKQPNFEEENIAKVYPYKFKIVENEEWNNALLKQDKRFACLTAYYFPISNNVYEATDNYSSINNDGVSGDEGGRIIQIFVVHVASDCLSEGADPGKKIEKIMGGIKKYLDKVEQKVNESEFKPR